MYKNIIKKLEFSNQTSVMISRYDTYHSIYINIILIPRIKIEKKIQWYFSIKNIYIGI